jgi:hypothetical protein
MLKRILLCVILVAASAAPPAWGVELAPFAVRNFSPPALIHGLPVAETARVNHPGQFSSRLGFDISNIATDDDRSGEKIVLDGETYVATFGLRYGLAEHLQVGIDLPWVWQSKGFLDGFIENFHDFFGMPNADRNNMSNNNINYVYDSRDGDDFLLDHATSGIGDVRLLGSWQWLDTEKTAANLQASIKAPSGDADKFTGSGGWDISLALSAQRDFPLENGHASLWGGLGGTWLGDGNVLQDRVENWAASGWLGAGWSPLDWLGLKLQLDSHSALYDSNLDEIGTPALILTLGGTLGLGEKTSLDIGVGEDLSIDASSDVTFHLSLAHQF